MSIFSSIGSALKGVYNTVKSVATGAYKTVAGQVASVGSALGYKTPAGTSQSATALNYNNPYNNTLQTSKANPSLNLPIVPGGFTPLPSNISKSNPYGAGFTPVTPGYGTAPVNYTPPKTISAGGGGGGGGSNRTTTNSDYSTGSYTNNFTSTLSATSPTSLSVQGGSIGGTGGTSAVMSSAPVGSNYYGANIGNNVKVGANPQTGIIPTDSTTDEKGNPIAEKKDSGQEALDKYLESLKKPASEADAYNKAQTEAGLLQAKIQKNNTQNAINAITTRMQTDLLQLRATGSREGVTEAVYGGQQAEVTREATIQLLPLQAQLAVDQGNLELAQSNTDTLFKIYSKDAQNSVDYYNNQVKAIYDFATTKEKQKLDEVLWQKNFNADTVKTDAKNQNEIAQQLLESGNMAGYKAITALRVPTNVNSPTFAQDYTHYKNDLASIVSTHGASVGALDRNIKQAQYDKIVAEKNQALNSLPGPVQTRVQGIASQFDNEQAVKNYQTSAEAIDALNTAGSSPTDDQSRIYAFAKVMDPNSVVRESEYRTVQDYSQSLLERYGFKAKRIFDNSGFLTNEARGYMKTTLENRLSSSKKAFDNIYSEYGRRIDKVTGKGDGKDYLTDYSRAFTTTSAPATSGTLTSGVTYKVVQ